MKKTTVKDLMTKDVITLEKEQAVPLAQEMMRTLHIRNLPVVDEKGNLAGLVTQPSLLAAQVELLSEISAGDPEDNELTVPVARVMTTDVATTSPDTPLADALEILLDRREGSLPVVDRDKVVGIITVRDFLAMTLRNLREGAWEAASTPAERAAQAGATSPSPAPAPIGMGMTSWLTVGLLVAILLLLTLLVVKDLAPPSSAESAADVATPAEVEPPSPAATKPKAVPAKPNPKTASHETKPEAPPPVQSPETKPEEGIAPPVQARPAASTKRPEPVKKPAPRPGPPQGGKAAERAARNSVVEDRTVDSKPNEPPAKPPAPPSKPREPSAAPAEREKPWVPEPLPDSW